MYLVGCNNSNYMCNNIGVAVSMFGKTAIPDFCPILAIQPQKTLRILEKAASPERTGEP
jgi:hypothetical protein